MSKNDPRNQELYVSIDIETDGPNPMRNSIRSIGAAIYNDKGKKLGEFYKKLEQLPGHQPSEYTLNNFWLKPENKAAWEEAQKDPENPHKVMEKFSEWVDSFPGVKVAVAQPVSFESAWIWSYCCEFGIQNPAFTRWIDIRSFAMGASGKDYKDMGYEFQRPEWLSDFPHTHIAIDDAIEQGDRFMKILRWRQQHELEEAKPGRAVD